MSGRKFTELNAGTVGANSIFAQAQAPATPGDPYTSTKVSATDVGNFVNGTQAYADIGNVTPLAAIAALQQGGASTANANIADEYDSSHTYNTGDRVIYEGVLYVCNDDNVTGAWDSTKWDSATIDEIISALTAADIPYSAGVSVADMLDITDITSDYCTTATGVTLEANDSSVYKQGNHIWGNLQFVIPSTTSQQVIATIASGFQPSKTIIGYAGYSGSKWSVDTIGSLYVGTNRNIACTVSVSGKTYVNIVIDYLTA